VLTPIFVHTYDQSPGLTPLCLAVYPTAFEHDRVACGTFSLDGDHLDIYQQLKQSRRFRARYTISRLHPADLSRASSRHVYKSIWDWLSALYLSLSTRMNMILNPSVVISINMLSPIFDRCQSSAYHLNAPPCILASDCINIPVRLCLCKGELYLF